MGIIQNLKNLWFGTHCDGCGKPLTECDRACQAAADVEAAWMRDIK